MKQYSLGKLDWKDRFIYKKNILFDAADLHQPGAKFQIVRFLPHTKIGPHYHKRVREIFYIQAGQGIIIFNGKHYSAKTNDIFLCEPKDIHEVINDSNEEFVMLIFKTNEDPTDITWINPKDEEKYG